MNNYNPKKERDEKIKCTVGNEERQDPMNKKTKIKKKIWKESYLGWCKKIKGYATLNVINYHTLSMKPTKKKYYEVK